MARVGRRRPHELLRAQIANSPVDSWAELTLGQFIGKIGSGSVPARAAQLMAAMLCFYGLDLW